MQWRIAVYNQGRTDITLDRVELVRAHGVTLHDAWTLDPLHEATLRSSAWEIERPGWTHDAGYRAVSGTAVPPVSNTARQGDAGIQLTLDVTMSRTGIYGSLDGVRVWEHEGGHKYSVVLPVAYAGCFVYPNKACPFPNADTATDILRRLGLKYTKPR